MKKEKTKEKKNVNNISNPLIKKTKKQKTKTKKRACQQAFAFLFCWGGGGGGGSASRFSLLLCFVVRIIWHYIYKQLRLSLNVRRDAISKIPARFLFVLFLFCCYCYCCCFVVAVVVFLLLLLLLLFCCSSLDCNRGLAHTTVERSNSC